MTSQPGSRYYPGTHQAWLFSGWLRSLRTIAAERRENRKRKAALEYLCSLDPHLQHDIGVKIIHSAGGPSLFQLHPVVVAAKLLQSDVEVGKSCEQEEINR